MINSNTQYELYHHGIKGQKWGIRRFQNEDGSYTAEGKKRYGRELAKKAYNALSSDKAQKALRGFAKVTKPLQKSNKKVDKNSDEYKQRQEKLKKAAKIGLAVAGTALAVYGTYKAVDFINNKKAVSLGKKAYEQTVKDRKLLEGLVEGGKKVRTGANAAYQQSYQVGRQKYSWTNYKDHPELVPAHLRNNSNKLLERSKFEGETPQEAYRRAYNSVRFKRKRI